MKKNNQPVTACKTYQVTAGLLKEARTPAPLGKPSQQTERNHYRRLLRRRYPAQDASRLAVTTQHRRKKKISPAFPATFTAREKKLP